MSGVPRKGIKTVGFGAFSVFLQKNEKEKIRLAEQKIEQAPDASAGVQEKKTRHMQIPWVVSL